MLYPNLNQWFMSIAVMSRYILHYITGYLQKRQDTFLNENSALEQLLNKLYLFMSKFDWVALLF